MKALVGLLMGMGFVGVLIGAGVAILSIVATVYGIVLAFKASILLGIVVFFVEPSPFIIGIVMLLFHKNLAQMLIEFLTK